LVSSAKDGAKPAMKPEKNASKNTWPSVNTTSGQNEADFAAKRRSDDLAQDLSSEGQVSEPDRKRPLGITNLQKKAMIHYKTIGLTDGEIEKIMAIPRGVVYYWTKHIHASTQDERPTRSNQDPNSNTNTDSRNRFDEEYVEQDMNVGMVPLKFRWSPNMVWLIGSMMLQEGYDDPDKWLNERLVPRWGLLREIEDSLVEDERTDPVRGIKTRWTARGAVTEYIDFTSAEEFLRKFRYHMDNSLRYLQALDELKKERIGRMMQQY